MLRKLENQLMKEGLNCDQAFKKCDANGDGFIILTEMKVFLGVTLSDTNITGSDLKFCMETLDTNNDGKITKDEFSKLFKNA
jgi:Ca2+-binding EF-hand superfamily protein